MPKLLTEAYAQSTFFVPLSADKSEGVWVKPLTETKRRQIRDACLQEAGHDQEIAMQYVVRDTLKACISDWVGFTDPAGKEIPFSQEILPSLCRCDPDFFAGLYLKVTAVARFGEIQDVKN